MTHRTHNVIKFPEPARLSFDDFLAQAQRYCVHIEAIHCSLVDVHRFFKEGKSIYPDYCNTLLLTLDEIKNPLQNFCALLDARQCLPIVVSSLRYPLLRILHQIDDVIAELTLLIAPFKTHCHESSRRIIAQRREIQRKLEMLIVHIEEIGQTVDTLPEQAKFRRQA